MFHTVLLVAALVLFLLAALGVTLPRRDPLTSVNTLIAAGLACWLASALLGP